MEATAEKITKPKELRYRFTPAKDPANSPLLVLFHGWAGHHYDWEHPEYNVFAPWDCFGLARNGCWWLGEDGQYFMLPMLDLTIKKLIAQYNIKPEIYCWGTSMGGFGALFHGLRWKAKAICVNVPQVRIQGSEYYKQYTKNIDKVFGADKNSKLSDVTNLLDRGNPTANPMIFLVQSRFDMYDRYVREQCFHLINVLNRYRINYYLNILPVKGHLILMGPDQAIDLIEQFKDSIDNPFTFEEA